VIKLAHLAEQDDYKEKDMTTSLIKAIIGAETPPCDRSQDGELLCEYWSLCAKQHKSCLTFARYVQTGGKYTRPTYDIPNQKTFRMIEIGTNISLKELRDMSNKLLA